MRRLYGDLQIGDQLALGGLNGSPYALFDLFHYADALVAE